MQQYTSAEASYSITSSARASRVGGISIPSAFAVLRLITSSNLVGACRVGRLLTLQDAIDVAGRLPKLHEDRIMQGAIEFVPACISAIAAYWRRKGPKQISMPLTPVGSAPIRKQGWSQ